MFFLGLAVLLLQPTLLPADSSQALAGRDFTGNFYPLYTYSAELVQRGELPLWNPRQFAGFPLAGNPQAAIFYPPTWAIWGLAAAGMSVPRALSLMIVLHVALAGWGFAVLVRRVSAATLGAALAAGAVYAMSGWVGARIYAGHYTILTVMAWIPFLMAGYHHALTRQTLGALLPAIGALGMTMLAGHPQMVLYGAIALVVMLGTHTLAHTPPEARRAQAWAGLWRLVLIGAGGALLGAGLLLPTAELVLQSTRTETSMAFVNQFHLPAAQLPTLALPFLYGQPHVTPSRYWGADFFEETTAYAGLLPLVALGLAWALPNRQKALWLAYVALGVLLALGADGVLFALSVYWVPAFSLFRSPGRFLFFVMLGLAGLLALMLSHLSAQSAQERRAWLASSLRVLPLIAAGLFVGAVSFSGWFAAANHTLPMPHRAAQVAGVLGYSALILLGVWGVLWLFAQDENPRRALVLAVALVVLDVWRVTLPLAGVTVDATQRPLWDGAAQVIPVDAGARVRAFADPNNYDPNAVNNASITGHLNVEGYDPLEIDSYTRLIQRAGSDPNHPIYTLLGLRYVLTWEPRADEGWTLIGVTDGGIYYERAAAPPRAWVVNSAELIPDDAAALERIASGALDFSQTAVLHAPLECPLGASASRAEITAYAPNRVQIRTEGDGGVLILSDQYYAGWQATLNDGTPLPIVRAYTALRAVCVPHGEQTITMQYRPLSVLLGAGLSAAGWLLWALASLITRGRHS